jgi:hypothetical protein
MAVATFRYQTFAVKKYLSFTPPQGRVAISVASKPCHECLAARFLFMTRFDIDLDKSQCETILSLAVAIISYVKPVRYISATSRVVIATDKKHTHAGGENIIEHKVALKFMKNIVQFQRERESREFFKNLDNYVVGIYDSYTAQDHKDYRDALANALVCIY